MTWYSNAIALQKDLAKKVVATDAFGKIENACGVDVAYDGDVGYCAAVTMDMQGGAVESASSVSAAEQAYIPGLFFLREAGPILRTLAMLKKRYDLLLIDGHGQLHPRKCGLACYVGLTVDKPTIGVAKSLLCGDLRNGGYVEFAGEVLGFAIGLGGNAGRRATKKMMYISVGHRLSLDSAIGLVRRLGKRNMPEPLRLADANARMQKRKKGLLPG